MSADKSGLHILKDSAESTTIQKLSANKKVICKNTKMPSYEQWKRLHHALGFSSESTISKQLYTSILGYAKDDTDIEVDYNGAYISIYDNLSIENVEKDAIRLSLECECELLYISCFEWQIFRIGICKRGEKLTEYHDDREGNKSISVLNDNIMNSFLRLPESSLHWSSFTGSKICSVLQSIMQKRLL